jgi:hypothetical protein
LPERVIPEDVPGLRDLLRAILSIWPEFEWQRMLDGTCAELEECALGTTHLSLPDQEVTWEVEKDRMSPHTWVTPLSTKAVPVLAGYSVDELFAGWDTPSPQAA